MPARSKIKLLPNALDLELYAGDGVAIQLTVTDTAGVPLTIEGEITAQIREARLDVDSMAEFSAEVVDPTMGVVVISLTGEQTAALIDTELLFNGAWDVQWVKPLSQPITLVQGTVKCYADVTR